MKRLRLPEEIKINGETLSKILLDHKAWHESNKKNGKRADLFGVNLSDTVLNGVNLNGADLSESDLRGAHLKNANLSNTNLHKAILTNADLSEADLTGAYLRMAVLSGAKLSNVTLHEADLSCAKLTRADLIEAKLREAKLINADLSAADLSGAGLLGADLSCANLSGAIFREVDLREANLHEADLIGVNLSNANLSKADLSSADLSDANLKYARLIEVNLVGSTLCKADLREAKLTRADLAEANLLKAMLSGANLIGTHLNKSNLSWANMSGATLRKVDLSGANLCNADLSGSDLSEANLSDTNFEKVSLTGVVFNRVATFNWEIGKIQCDYFFNDSDKKNRYPKDRNFEPGEFEDLYKSVPTFEFIFEKGMNWRDAIVLDYIISNMQDEYPGLKLLTLESRGKDPRAIIQVLKKEIIQEVDEKLKQIFTKMSVQIDKSGQLISKSEEYQQLVRQLPANATLNVFNNYFISPVEQVNQNSVEIGQYVGQFDEIYRLFEEASGKLFNGENQKSTIRDGLKEIRKHIVKGAFEDAGKRLMDLGIHEVVPRVAPYIMKLVSLLMTHGEPGTTV